MGRIEHKGETLLDMKETTKVIGCSDSFVYKLAQAGKLETLSVKGYRGKRFTLSSVVTYLTSKKFRRGIEADDILEAFHQLERRVRVLEAREKRRGGVEGPVDNHPDYVSQIVIDKEVRKRHPDFFD